MYMFQDLWMLVMLLSAVIIGIRASVSKQIVEQKEISGNFYSAQALRSALLKERLPFVKRVKTSPAERVADDQNTPKHGSFKIDDGKVIGGGIYEIDKNGVTVDINLKIAPHYQGSGTPAAPGESETTPASGGSKTTAAPGESKTTPAPGGSETTAAPGESETTPAPGGSETTAAPGESKTTPAPGGSETTAAPGESETTPAPGGSETTAAPGESKTTPAPGGSETTAAPGESKTTPAPGAEGSDVEKEALELHNKFRKVHDAPAMKLNAEMSQSAASYAAKIAQMGSLKHASKEERNNNGENLSYGCSSSKGQTAAEAVNNWYNEVCSPGYSFGSESAGGAGHFTQLVWKESVELGFGKADSEESGMKCTYYVARYKPAGNMGGEFAKNVVKGSFDQSYCSSIKKRDNTEQMLNKALQ